MQQFRFGWFDSLSYCCLLKTFILSARILYVGFENMQENFPPNTKNDLGDANDLWQK